MSEVNPRKLVNREQQNSNDSLFANLLKFDEQAKNNTISTLIFGKKDNNSLWLGTKKDDIRSIANNNNKNDTKSAFISVFDYIESLLRRSIHNYTK